MAWSRYAFVALRIVVASFWLNIDIPRWVALASGKPVVNVLVRVIFGRSLAVPLTYFFALLETLAAAAFILGLGVRLAALWAIIQFAIIDASTLVLVRNTGQVLDVALLLVASLVLFLYGSTVLSLDGLIARRMRTASQN
jgi:uncharacterized membrane protein YphA (DoxX/SURF4 family)